MQLDAHPLLIFPDCPVQKCAQVQPQPCHRWPCGPGALTPQARALLCGVGLPLPALPLCLRVQEPCWERCRPLGAALLQARVSFRLVLSTLPKTGFGSTHRIVHPALQGCPPAAQFRRSFFSRL